MKIAKMTTGVKSGAMLRGPAAAQEEKPQNEEVILGPGKLPIQLQVNGQMYSLNVEPRRTLLDTLRIDLHLTGTKKVCNMGECGACTVLLDGKAVYSCLILAVEAEGHAILTIEGLGKGDQLDPIQEAFIYHDAFQCGFCTPGQIMSVRGLLEHNNNPTRDDIRRAVSGNICRCGAYLRIFAAAEESARKYTAQSCKPKRGRNGKTR
jgi:aerobic-type carbon monoxide dehydrogenase small subunit (CoxS/CutS family)